MCLAIPARVDELEGEDAWVTLGETRLRINVCMTPGAGVGDWVLVHAGFAIEQLDEKAAKETWGLIGQLERARAEESP